MIVLDCCPCGPQVLDLSATDVNNKLLINAGE